MVEHWVTCGIRHRVQTNKQADTPPKRHTHTNRQTHKQISDTPPKRHTDWQTDRHVSSIKHTDNYRHTTDHTGRQTDN